jgi:hypothetical protein
MTVDVRVEIEDFTIAVIDGFCNGTGYGRKELINEILGDWAYKKHHEATIILRVAGNKPDDSDRRRHK